MSKPITIRAVDGGYTVEVSDVRSRAFGAKKRKVQPDGFVSRNAEGAVVIGRLQAPVTLSAEDAKSIAHTVGRYMLGFGDLVFAYTDAPSGFWEVCS